MTTADSDKPFKTDAHRAERRSTRTKLASGIDADDPRMHAKVYGDPWLSPKDGWQMIDPKSKWMRK